LDHDATLVALETTDDLVTKFAKPALIILALLLSAAIGHQFDAKTLMDLFK
jgi:hypothetical protein